jgi:hypothetical protein
MINYNIKSSRTVELPTAQTLPAFLNVNIHYAIPEVPITGPNQSEESNPQSHILTCNIVFDNLYTDVL